MCRSKTCLVTWLEKNSSCLPVNKSLRGHSPPLVPAVPPECLELGSGLLGLFNGQRRPMSKPSTHIFLYPPPFLCTSLSYLSHLIIFLKFIFYWSIGELQCCANYCCTAVTQLHICIHSFFHILFHYGLSQDIEYSSLCYTVGPYNFWMLRSKKCS